MEVPAVDALGVGGRFPTVAPIGTGPTLTLPWLPATTMSSAALISILHRPAMTTTDEYIDGFLRYDAFPSRSFAARGLPVSLRSGSSS